MKSPLRILACAPIAIALCLSAAVTLRGELTPQRVPPQQPAAEPPPLALGGFCPVTLRDRQVWQPGDEKVVALFDGQLFRFAGQRELEIFAAAPQEYAPLLGGDCPIAFAEEGRRIAGRLEYGLLHGGDQLIFFASEQNRQRFLDEPKQFKDAHLALGGRCPVSRVDEQREVDGIPELAVIHHGLRFTFASALARSTFLKDPSRYDGTGGTAPPSPDAARPADKPVADEGAAKSPPPKLWIAPKPSENPAAGAAAGPSHEEDVVLGALPVMSGYCPVTLVRDGAWVRGRYEYRKEIEGKVFLTAGPKERDALAAEPAKYLSALCGDCVVSFLARQERVRGSVYHAYQYQGRLFLFADAERKAAFSASPERYSKADYAASGMCVITKIEEHRDVPGLPEFAAWHAGKLYLFAGEEQKQKFLKEPARYER